MLSGKFINCYGLKEFEMSIDFSNCNKAIIYAPNGVMKTSFSNVFEDISKGAPTSDRIFKDVTTAYSITHYTSEYNFSSASNPTVSPEPTNKIYVVNTFADKFEFTKETVSTLLADETTRHEYGVLVSQFSGEIRQIEEKLKQLTGFTKPKIKGQLIKDFGLSTIADWTDIFEKLVEVMPSYTDYPFYEDITYTEIFNTKTLDIYTKPEFINSIEDYILTLSDCFKENPVLSERFNDRCAEALGKAFRGNDLFEAKHTIRLKDGVTIIRSAGEWNDIVAKQLKEIYEKPELNTEFSKLKTTLTKNNEVSRVRDIIIKHREIIPFLTDLNRFKILIWLNCMNRLDKSFGEYATRITEFTQKIKELHEKAAQQSERWQEVVTEFNRRFKMPFEVEIKNKANFLLKDEAPNLIFTYTMETEEGKKYAELRKNDLMISLSTGEKRALYLLYILFDLERIRKMAVSGAGKFLIIADDIADSFDYKNKYAIIEYLNDLAKNSNIDLLMLTHNFDFYRTIMSRLGIIRQNCYIAQKDPYGLISIAEFKYKNDFFKNIILANIRDGNINTDERKKLLISSIPFYRNLCEYNGNENDYKKLTCFLHLKTDPFDTSNAELSDLWNIITQFLGSGSMIGSSENYLVALQRLANNIVSSPTNEVFLENKLLVSIAIRLETEIFLKTVLNSNGITCEDSSNNQTREWFNLAQKYLTIKQKEIIEEVNIITPECIHINSFMYEPLIDISDWTFKELYNSVKKLDQF